MRGREAPHLPWGGGYQNDFKTFKNDARLIPYRSQNDPSLTKMDITQHGTPTRMITTRHGPLIHNKELQTHNTARAFHNTGLQTHNAARTADSQHMFSGARGTTERFGVRIFHEWAREK